MGDEFSPVGLRLAQSEVQDISFIKLKIQKAFLVINMVKMRLLSLPKSFAKIN